LYQVEATRVQGITGGTSLFIYNKQGITMFLLVYVGDIILTSSNSQAVKALLSVLKVKFALNDLNNLHYFMGIQVMKKDNGVLLSQEKYTTNLLE
jgi:hypothetical protein